MIQGNKLTLVTAAVGLLLIAALVAWQLRPVLVQDALGEPLITFGSPYAPHQLVAFISTTCTHCARFELETGHELYERAARGELFYALYPLTMTKGAEDYTKGFLCAAEGGELPSYCGFYYQEYFITQQANLQELAERAGLDVEDFTRCIRAERTTEYAQQAQAWAETQGVQRTPTFYLKGPGEAQWRKVRGNQGEVLTRWLESE